MQLQFAGMDLEQWKSKGSPYDEGLQMLLSTGASGFLVDMLKGGESFFNRKKLNEALHALPQRQAVQPATAAVDKPPAKGETVQPDKTQWGSAKPLEEYPEPLHPAVHRLRELYNLVNNVHPQLLVLYSSKRKECFRSVQTLIKAWNEIDDIYRILRYYDSTGQILPNSYQKQSVEERFDQSYYKQRLLNLRTYVSRDKNNPRKVDKVKAWKEEIAQLEALLP